MNCEYEAKLGIDFFRYTQICISTFGVLFLFLIWRHIKTKENVEEKDNGLLYLSLSLVMWIAADYYAKSSGNCSDKTMRTLSTLNNLFLLLSLPYFQKVTEKLSYLNNIKTWFTGVLFFTALLTATIQAAPDWKFLVKFDFFYSAIALGLVGGSITYSFYRRNYGIGFIIVGTLITILLIATQISTIWVYDYSTKCSPILDMKSAILGVVAKMGFVTLSLMLAQTWVVEESLKEKDLEIEGLKAKIMNNDESIKIDLNVLSETEQKVLAALNKSPKKTAEKLAKELGIKESTFRSHIHSIGIKLGIKGGKENLIKYYEDLTNNITEKEDN